MPCAMRSPDDVTKVGQCKRVHHSRRQVTDSGMSRRGAADDTFHRDREKAFASGDQVSPVRPRSCSYPARYVAWPRHPVRVAAAGSSNDDHREEIIALRGIARPHTTLRGPRSMPGRGGSRPAALVEFTALTGSFRPWASPTLMNILVGLDITSSGSYVLDVSRSAP